MTDFATYTEPEFEGGDSYKPADHIDRPLIVMVNEHKPSIITQNSPEGGPGVIVDLVDLTDGEVYRSVLWMSGAVVDGLKAHAGTRKPLLIQFATRKSKSGRTYPVPAACDADATKLAEAFYAAKGDPFTPTFASPEPAEEAPPF